MKAMIFVILFAISILIIGSVYYKFNDNTINETITDESIDLTQESVEEKSQELIPYTVEVIESPVLEHRSNNGFDLSFRFKLLNDTLEPFITTVGINTCTVEYNNNLYKTTPYGSNLKLENALLPGNTFDLVFDNIGITFDFISENEISCENPDISGLFEKCIYDNNGVCECKPIKLDDINLVQCEFAVKTDGGQADNGWGEHPTKIIFNK